MKKRLSVKLISILSALILLLNCFVVQAATPATQFSDVKKADWYYAAVKYAVENNLMNGVGGGKFAPNDAASRAMLVTLLYRMEGEPKVSAKTPFKDLKDDWYKKPVAWAYTNKIVNGTSDTTFGPTNPLTREQFATIMYRYCKEFLGLDVSTNAKLTKYPDYKSISSYAKDAMAWANAEGLITGSKESNKTYLRPGQTATRAQMATIFQRFDNYLEQQEPEQETPVAPPAEKPCDFGGEANHKSGTRGMQSRHYYFCQDDGCVEIKEVACSIRVQTTPATCKDYSETTYSCALCGYEETLTNTSQPLADHNWVNPTHIDNQEPSSHYYTCKYDGCKKEKQEPCTFTTTKIPAEVGKNGTINYSCTVCGYAYSVIDPNAPALKDPNGATIKLMSQNLRQNADKDQQTDNDAQLRQYRFKSLVEKYDPDIIATQEADDFWEKALPKLLGENYTMYFKYRESPSGSDEACAILWKKDRFEQLGEGTTFWLSENPNSPNPAGFGKTHPRICSWVRLMDKESGVTIRVASTHLDFYDDNEQVKVIRKLFEKECENAGDEPYILMGDFNIGYQEEQYNVLTNTNAFYDLRPAAEAAAKKGQCTLGDIRTGSNGAFSSSIGSRFVDHIFAGTKTPVEIKKFGYYYDRFPENWDSTGAVSDHFAVFAEIKVK